MNTQFLSVVGMMSRGPFPTFQQAFADWLPRVEELYGRLPAKQVRQTSWIEGQFSSETGRHLNIELMAVDVVNLAKSTGLVDGEGKLTDQTVPTITEVQLKAAYFDAHLGESLPDIGVAAPVAAHV